jgi:hypothetical protein
MKVRRAFKPHIWLRFRGKGLHGNVVLNFTKFPKGEFGVYARAYHEAGQHVGRRLAERRGYRDADACPIVFLYRHALELYLKSFIYWGNSLLRMNKKAVVMKQQELFRTHNLLRLAAATRPIFRLAGSLTRWPDTSFKSFKHFERLLKELDRTDPRSYSFRYPINNKGDASLPGHFCFNVSDFAAQLDQLLNLLSGADTWAYEMFQAQAEAEYNNR